MILIDNAKFVKLTSKLTTDDFVWFSWYVYFYNEKPITFIERVKEHGFIKILKKNNLYKVTGARNTKKSFIDEKLYYFLCMKYDAKFYANELMAINGNNFVFSFTSSLSSVGENYPERSESVYLDYLYSLISGFVSVERQYNVLGYRIDLYLPELNIAVEFDEAFHNRNSKPILDKKREIEIINKIGCTFFRINDDKNSKSNIEKLANDIIGKCTGVYHVESCFVSDIGLKELSSIVTDFKLYVSFRNKAALGDNHKSPTLTNIEKNKISSLEENMAFAVNMGYIKTFDGLLEELRKLYIKQIN